MEDQNKNQNPSVPEFAPVQMPNLALPQHQPSYKRHLKAVLIAALAGILVFAGSTGAYIYLKPTPEKVFNQFYERLGEIKTLDYDGEVVAQVSSGMSLTTFLNGDVFRQKSEDRRIAGMEKYNARFDFTGSSDVQDLDKPKYFLSFTITSEGLIVALETLFADNEFYLRLSPAPDLGIIDLSSIKNKWIKFDKKYLEQQLGTDLSEESLSIEQKNRMKEAFLNANLFSIDEMMDDQVVNGVKSYHFKYSINKNNYRDFVIKADEITYGRSLTSEELEHIDESLRIFEFLPGEIWISKKDLMPTKIIGSVRAAENPMNVSGSFSFVLNLKNINQPVKIDPPLNFRSIEDVVKEFTANLQQNYMALPYNEELILPEKEAIE